MRRRRNYLNVLLVMVPVLPLLLVGCGRARLKIDVAVQPIEKAQKGALKNAPFRFIRPIGIRRRAPHARLGESSPWPSQASLV